MSKHSYIADFEFVLRSEYGDDIEHAELLEKEFGAASAFLDREMSEFYDGDAADKIKSIKWTLEGTDGGCVIVETSDELSDDERKDVSAWIKGQCSDGIGESFEQRDFAEVYDEFAETCLGMLSFDWESNNYELR